MSRLPETPGATVLTPRQREILFASGFDRARGCGWTVGVQGGTRNSARILANRYGLGTLSVDDEGYAHFTANREGCRVFYADQVAAFEERRR